MNEASINKVIKKGRDQVQILKIMFALFLSIQTYYAHAQGACYNGPAKKTVFLTGAAGFIGSNFLKYMFDKYPEYQFIVLDALTYAGNLDNIPDYIKNSNRFEFIQGSVTNYRIVSSIMCRSNYVVHFAAESHVTRSIFDDSTFFETDVMGTQVMMRCLVDCGKSVERYIHISTSEVCGTAESQPMDEEHPIKPRSPYAAAKAGADRIVYAYWCTYDIPALIIRPFNNYGPRQHAEKMLPRFIIQAIKGKKLTIHGNGEQTRDWIYTLDLARALDKALHMREFSKIKNQVIHVGSGIATSVVDMARAVLKYFSMPDDYIEFITDRPGQVETHISSTEKAHDLLGWKSDVNLEQGIAETIEWYIEHRHWWERMETVAHIPVTAQNGTTVIH